MSAASQPTRMTSVTWPCTFSMSVAPAWGAAGSYNGLANTPPMGFNDWNAYGCNVSETLIKQTADKIVSVSACGWECTASSTATLGRVTRRSAIRSVAA